MAEIHDRIIVVKNPACTHWDRVGANVLEPYRQLIQDGDQLVEFDIPIKGPKLDPEYLAEKIENGDRIIVPAGDGTGNFVVNAVMMSQRVNTKIGFLPYGNLNDMASTFTGREGRKYPERLLWTEHNESATPLRIDVDSTFHKYALLYANLGWTARVAEVFDDPGVRQSYRGGSTGRLASAKRTAANLLRMADIYFHDRNNEVLPQYMYNGTYDHDFCPTDLLAINGPIMGNHIRTGRRYNETPDFLCSELDVRSLPRNVPFLGRCVLNRTPGFHMRLPGQEVAKADINFLSPANFKMQIDGEPERIQATAVSISKEPAYDRNAVLNILVTN